MPSGPNVNGPIDCRCGPLAAVITGCTAGAYPMMATNPSTAAIRVKRLRIPVTLLERAYGNLPRHGDQQTRVSRYVGRRTDEFAVPPRAGRARRWRSEDSHPQGEDDAAVQEP